MLREDIIEELAIESPITYKSDDSYVKIIETILRVIKGKVEEIDDSEECKTNSLYYSSINLIGTIIEEKGLDRLSIDFGSFSNKECIELFDFIDSTLDEYIGRYTINYSPEELLLKTLTFSSVISKCTFSVYAEDVTSSNNNWGISEIEQILREIDSIELFDIRSVLGEIKGALEVAVDSILLKRVAFSLSITKKDIDYFKLLTLFNAKNIVNQSKEIVPILGESRKKIKLSKNLGIILPNKIMTAFNTYGGETKNEQIRVENNLTSELFEIFNESLGFKPETILRYASLEEDKRAFRIYDNLVSIADSELLPLDIMFNQGLESRGVNNMMRIFTLNNDEFYEKNSSKNENHLGSANNRLFRAPIIKLDSKILIPTYTWLESLKYLSLRILRRNIFSDIITDTWNEMVKQTYDEYDLYRLKADLKSKNFDVYTNVDLSQNSLIKKKLESVKKMPHEIDLLYFNKGNMFIFDLKNYGMQHNFSDVRKVVQKINKQKGKMNRLKQFISDNKYIFEKIYGQEINKIIMGILTVNSTVYPYISDNKSKVKVMSVQKFQDELGL